MGKTNAHTDVFEAIQKKGINGTRCIRNHQHTNGSGQGH